MSEKGRPTYDLNAIKAAFATAQGFKATGSAVRNAAALGFGRAEIIETIQSIQRTHFHKSMTSDAVTGFLLLSFKEKANG